MKKVLFVCYGGGHVRMIVPVVQHLTEHKMCDVTILGLSTACSTLREHNIKYLSFKDFLEDSNSEAIFWGEKLSKLMHPPNSTIPYKESVAYFGLSFLDKIHQVGLSQAWMDFERIGRLSFLPLGVIGHIFDKIKPDVVVTTTSPRAERAALEVSINRGIPHLAMSDLLGHEIYRIKSHNVSVSCLLAIEVLKNSGAEVGCYHLTGNPAMDNLLECKKQNHVYNIIPLIPIGAKLVLYLCLLVKRDENSVLYVPKSSEDLFNEMDRVAFACQLLGATLLIRPHPNESPNLYLRWLNQQKICSAFYVGNIDIHLLLKSVDAVIGVNSTVFIGSLYAGCPVVILQESSPYAMNEFSVLVDLGLVLLAKIDDVQNITYCLKRSIFDMKLSKKQRINFKENFPTDAATPKVSKLILELG